MQIDENTTVAVLAAEFPETTRVFQKMGIDFCCGGQATLSEACTAHGLQPQTLMTALQEEISERAAASGEGWQTRPLRELVAHILSTHHVYTRDELERLGQLLNKVCSKHEEHHPVLKHVRQVFKQLEDELIPHMLKEENILFPYIVERECNGSAEACFGSVQGPITVMQMEHEAAGALLARMRSLTSNYQPPPDVCPSFRALYQGLELLEKDLHQHIHLENNVLFPRAV